MNASVIKINEAQKIVGKLHISIKEVVIGFE